MDTLRDRLADLADGAPTGGAPPAEIWARGKRTQTLKAAALASSLLVVIAVGGRLGVRLPDPQPDVLLAPGDASGITLPINYPAGQELPDLGNNPGPLAAVWLAPREPYTLDDDDPGLAPEAVGLVAETGRFGTLPVDLYAWAYEAPDATFALSPDGRRIAYYSPPEGPELPGEETSGDLVVRDLVTGESYSPAFDFEVRSGASWVDATHLVGHVAGGSDADGWVWDAGEPATPPKLVDPYRYFEGFGLSDSPFLLSSRDRGDGPWSCHSPTMTDRDRRSGESVVCDVLGVIGSETLLGHHSGAPGDPNDPDRAVVAVDISDPADFPFDDRALRRVVVTEGAPYPVSFATALIAEALEADGDAS